MKIPVIYWFLISKYVFRLFHIHTGFDDRSLIWIVNGWSQDILFMKIRTKFNFKKWYKNGKFAILGISNIYHNWNNLMYKLYKKYTVKHYGKTR